MARKGTAVLWGGTFRDRAGARAALEALVGETGPSSADIDVAFYGSRGEYVLLAAAKSPEAERWVTRVLRQYGAVVPEPPLVERLAAMEDPSQRGSGRKGAPDAEERALLAQWAGAAMLLLAQGALAPDDLLALLVAAGERSNVSSADERRQRQAEVDAELRTVAEQLEASLRARYPDLFDRRGRLRSAELARRLAERLGSTQVLSGDELRALEDQSDVAAGRSVSAP